MAGPTSIRFPDDLRARVEAAAVGREKFSATVIRLVEEALGGEPPTEGPVATVRVVDLATGKPVDESFVSGPLTSFRPDFGSKLSK